jgi:hypothetical protein
MPGSTYIKAKKAHHTNASPTRLPYTLTYPTLTARFTLHYTYQPLPNPPTLHPPTYPTPRTYTTHAAAQAAYPTPRQPRSAACRVLAAPYPSQPTLQPPPSNAPSPPSPDRPPYTPFPGTTHKMRRPRQSSHAGHLCLANQRADSAARHILAPTSLPYTRPSPDKSKPRPSTGAEIRPSPPTLQPHQSPPRKAP